MKVRWVLLATLIVLLASDIAGIFEFTKIVCLEQDRNFAVIPYCFIKAINRSYKYISLRVNLLQIPIDNVTVNVAIFKRANGYKPFLYNVTFDACRFLRMRNKNVLVQFLYGFLAKQSNMNHTCPYDHDLILDKLDVGMVNTRLTDLLPFPPGDYNFFTSWRAYNKERAQVHIYGHLD